MKLDLGRGTFLAIRDWPISRRQDQTSLSAMLAHLSPAASILLLAPLGTDFSFQSCSCHEPPQLLSRCIHVEPIALLEQHTGIRAISMRPFPALLCRPGVEPTVRSHSSLSLCLALATAFLGRFCFTPTSQNLISRSRVRRIASFASAGRQRSSEMKGSISPCCKSRSGLKCPPPTRLGNGFPTL